MANWTRGLLARRCTQPAKVQSIYLALRTWTALILGDKANMKVPERPGTLPIDATRETETLHIPQALTLCGKTLADAKRPESDRALALCRIAHLVADAHHPCHAGSRNQITLTFCDVPMELE